MKAPGKDRVSRVVRLEWIALAFLLLGLAVALRHLPVSATLERATLSIESLGWWAPATFVVLYVVCTMLLLPRTVLTVGAGFLFGPLHGLLWALLAINLGANLAFLSGRHLLRNVVERRIHADGRIQALDQAVAGNGWRIVALMRMTPVFPYSLLNYALGLTRIRWRHFALGSLAGMFPGTAMLVILGTFTDFAAEKSDEPTGLLVRSLYAVGVIVTLLATWWVTRFAKRTLDRHRAASSGSVAGSPPA